MVLILCCLRHAIFRYDFFFMLHFVHYINSQNYSKLLNNKNPKKSVVINETKNKLFVFFFLFSPEHLFCGAAVGYNRKSCVLISTLTKKKNVKILWKKMPPAHFACVWIDFSNVNRGLTANKICRYAIQYKKMCLRLCKRMSDFRMAINLIGWCSDWMLISCGFSIASKRCIHQFYTVHCFMGQWFGSVLLPTLSKLFQLCDCVNLRRLFVSFSIFFRQNWLCFVFFDSQLMPSFTVVSTLKLSFFLI